MATVRIPTPLRKFTKGQDEVAAAGTNIGALLADLEKNHPGSQGRLGDDTGAVRRLVNIFDARDDVRFLQNLDTPVNDSDEVSIVPAIAGGAKQLSDMAFALDEMD